jgi:hypothetical protein
MAIGSDPAGRIGLGFDRALDNYRDRAAREVETASARADNHLVHA